MTKPLLSIGMIVKNEERCLEKCLKALKPLRDAIPCELVIADTGSTDKTREIAEKYADVVFDFEWINDFAAARNAVIDKSTGEWFLTVDADEYLTSSVTEIVDFLKNPPNEYLLASTVIRNYGNAEMTGIYSDFNAVRMVKKDSNIRYCGAIHESYNVTDLDTIKVLSATVFDHDGYANISQKHTKEKENRNLELLEKELEENPNDIRRILQCLESSTRNIEKRRCFTKYAVEKLKSISVNDDSFKMFGPSCAKEVVKSLLADHDLNAKEFTEWAVKTFPYSYYITIDINHLWVKEYYQKEDFENCSEFSKKYLKALDSYNRQKNLSNCDIFVGTPDFVHEYYRFENQTILANALIELDKIDEALYYLEKVDLSEVNTVAVKNWFNAVYRVKTPSKIAGVVGKVVDELLKTYQIQEVDVTANYNLSLTLIQKAFTCKKLHDEDYNVFSEVSGAIGYSVKIANAQTKEEVEEYLEKVDNWKEFMPVALSKVIEFNINLPKEFYFMNYIYSNLIINDLMHNIKNISGDLINNYFDVSKHSELYEITFSFNFISFLILHKSFNDLTADDKMKFIIAFCNSAEVYLSNCYNEEFLNNEEMVSCMPKQHLLGLYFIRAIKLKETDSLGYIKALRAILKKQPEIKQVIEFLIEEIKKEEELRKQEKIKNTSPELLAMAEQLKTMLAAFPTNSPELLAIKQSPMYKQLAFLIED